MWRDPLWGPVERPQRVSPWPAQQLMLKSIAKTIACAGVVASNGTLSIFWNVEIQS
jgi:hypothetical protein